MGNFIQEILLLLNEGCGNFYINVDGETVWDTKEYCEHGYSTITSRMCADEEHIEIFDEMEDDLNGREHYYRYWIEGIQFFKVKCDDNWMEIRFTVQIDGSPNQQVEIGMNNLSSCGGAGGL